MTPQSLDNLKRNFANVVPVMISLLFTYFLFNLGGPLIPASWNKDVKDRLMSYMLNGHYSHNLYALRFTFCELLNFINVVSMDIFIF